MRTISHQVKSYRRRFRLFPSYVLRSRIFILIGLLALFLTTAVFWIVTGTILDQPIPYALNLGVVALCEVPLVLGFFQLLIEANRRRYLLVRPGAAEPGFRLALMTTVRDKAAAVELLFGRQQSFEALAKRLIDQWEWHRSIIKKSGDPIVRKARGFFGFPLASNLATYVGGLLAIGAAIVVTLLDEQAFYAQLPSLMGDVSQLVWLMTKVFVIPLAMVVIPLATIVGTTRSLLIRACERVDDDYLSEVSFYAFIKELLELEERKTRRLLMTTTGVVYWGIRLGTAPLQDVPKVYRNMQRSRRLQRKRATTSEALP